MGFDFSKKTGSESFELIKKYIDYLCSTYHHKLPINWITSVLFAHLMQRPNKIKHSDKLDITWASAYLPFVDYAITDGKFCDLLNSSGLADLYGTKVYKFKTLCDLVYELDNIE